jgi:hypothetical protein
MSTKKRSTLFNPQPETRNPQLETGKENKEHRISLSAGQAGSVKSERNNQYPIFNNRYSTSNQQPTLNFVPIAIGMNLLPPF